MENIDSLIIERLGEYQRKTAAICKYISDKEQRRPSFRRVSYSVLSVAACLAIVLIVSPLLFNRDSISDISVSAPSFDEYRGSGFEDIESLISTEQYEQALSLVNRELSNIEIELKDAISSGMSNDERNYTLALYSGEKEELLWSRIYILVKLGKREEAKAECNKYLNDNDFNTHRIEAEMILKKL